MELGGAFDQFLQGVQKTADTYNAVRTTIATGKAPAAPVVQTQGNGAPLVQQGAPAQVQAVAANSTKSEAAGSGAGHSPWLLGLAVVLAVGVAVYVVKG